MSRDLYIPSKIKVGFQKRSDTFTGKLAYVTFYKNDALFRERSWEGWRDSKIDPVELDNVPSRYVLNKGVQRSGSFGSGRSVIRVYDTRDFEFEISVDNLMAILMHSDVSKRDITEECVFAWAGQTLVLLSVNSEEYQKSVKFTQKQHTSVSAKDLKPGFNYLHKKEEGEFTYIGHHAWWLFDSNSGYTAYTSQKKGKKHVFFNGFSFEAIDPKYISCAATDEEHPEFSTLLERFHTSIHAGPVLNVSFALDSVYPMEPLRTGKVLQMYRQESENVYSELTVYEFARTYQYSHPSRIKIQPSNAGGLTLTRYYNHNGSNGIDLEIKNIGDKYVADNQLDPEKLTVINIIEIYKLAGFGYLHAEVVIGTPTDFNYR